MDKKEFHKELHFWITENKKLREEIDNLTHALTNCEQAVLLYKGQHDRCQTKLSELQSQLDEKLAKRDEAQ